jgi:hypothetical protein
MGKFIKVSRDDLFNADSKAKREALEKAYGLKRICMSFHQKLAESPSRRN